MLLFHAVLLCLWLKLMESAALVTSVDPLQESGNILTHVINNSFLRKNELLRNPQHAHLPITQLVVHNCPHSLTPFASRNLITPCCSLVVKFCNVTPRCPRIHCRVNWTEHTNTCIYRASSHMCTTPPNTTLESLDILLRYHKVAYLNSNRFGCYDVSFPLCMCVNI